MSSNLQIAANRRNAKKSTGPRSIEGKAISSQNSLKTGIYAESAIIQGESANDLQALTDEYYARFQPSTPERRALVDTLVNDEWLLRRFRRIEAAMFARRLEPLDSSYCDETERNSGDAYIGLCKTLWYLQRRITETERSFHSALKALESRHFPPETPSSASEPPRPQPVTPPPPPLTAGPHESASFPQTISIDDLPTSPNHPDRCPVLTNDGKPPKNSTKFPS
jgi:hypothetical protein